MSIIYFILVLSVTIFIHELGHFLFAKMAKIYVYDFSVGMGKKIFSYKKKDGETEYCLRLIPLGGFVRLAGEDIEDEKEIPKDRLMYNKPVYKRFLTLVAGAGFNFLLAIFLLFFVALIWGSAETKPILGEVGAEYPAYQEGIREGDKILSIDSKKVRTWDDASFIISLSNGKTLTFEVKDKNDNVNTYKVTPEEIKDEEGNITYRYGISMPTTRYRGFVSSVNYSISKTGSLFRMMFNTIASIFTGNVGVKDLSGPVGIYTVVDSQSKEGFANILYLIAFLSINVGFINLIPFPAFDGGRLLFLIIEKIKGSPVDPKIENMIHNIGFFLLLALMVYVTFNDILRLLQ